MVAGLQNEQSICAMFFSTIISLFLILVIVFSFSVVSAVFLAKCLRMPVRGHTCGIRWLVHIASMLWASFPFVGARKVE